VPDDGDRALVHDLNNLLQVVVVEVQRDAAEGGTLGSTLAPLAAEAALITRQLLHGGTREHGTGVSSVGEIIRTLEPALRAILATSAARLHLELLDLGDEIHASPSELRSVVRNLVENARQAGARSVRLATHLAEGRLILDVVDDGSGMSDAIAERAFSPQFTTRPHGSGLGLAWVRDVVSRAGGSVALKSAPGTGTHLRLAFLPVRPPDI